MYEEIVLFTDPEKGTPGPSVSYNKCGRLTSTTKESKDKTYSLSKAENFI